MKIISFYLPQFHSIPENDKWWGKGYTEWTAVSKAVKLFKGHNQPRIPYEYYNLLDKSTMKKQSEYMHKFSVDGMCFYHYYFKNGLKLLQKPAENLLEWKDIDMPFCFAWDNASWVRSWSNLGGNDWNIELEKVREDFSDSGVLADFSYGDEKQWRDHFYYLLPFFKDKRYIRNRRGNPIFILWNTDDTDTIKKMKNYWDILAQKEGIDKISLVCNGRMFDESFDAVLIQEPHKTISNYFSDVNKEDADSPIVLDYDKIWEKLLARSYTYRNVYLGAFVGYDDTPRRGKRGKVIQGQTPDKFKNYMAQLLVKADLFDSEFVFLNAWNEWGEGMYLEPDQQDGFAYLEAFKEARNKYESSIELIKNSVRNIKIFKNEKQTDPDLKKYYYYFNFYKKWVELEIENKRIAKYLEDNNIANIAIYGLGTVGKLFLKKIVNEGIHIKYGIDSNINNIDNVGFEIYKPYDELPPVDMVIVTMAYEYENVVEQLAKNINCKIVPLCSIIEELMA